MLFLKIELKYLKGLIFFKLKIPKEPSFCPEPVTLKFRLELTAEVSQGKNC